VEFATLSPMALVYEYEEVTFGLEIGRLPKTTDKFIH
jgi:hypothetical protein